MDDPEVLKRVALSAVHYNVQLWPDRHDRNQSRGIRFTQRRATDELIQSNNKTSREFSSVDDRIDRLVLLCEAMWELLEEETDLTRADLERRFTEVDERDGRRNFRRQREAQPCECGAKVPPARLSCQFCGAPSRPKSFFDLV